MLRYILSILLYIVAFQATGEEYVIEKVCLGAERHYRVDGQPGSTYAWMVDDVVLTNPNVTTFKANDPVTGIPIEGSEITIKWDKVGVYKLAVIQYSMFNCDTLEQGLVEVVDRPLAIAGDPLNICSGTMVELTTAQATNASSTLWTSSGDGTFDDPLALQTNYHFGVNDIQQGSVQLTLSAQGLGASSSCPQSSSTLSVTLKPDVLMVTHDPPSVCLPTTIDLSAPEVTMGSEPGLTFRYFTDRYATKELTNYTKVDKAGMYYIEGTNKNTGCSILDSVEVIFNPLNIPTFSTIGDICLNTKAPELPNADLKGIGGRWSPAKIVTNVKGPQTYTFIPDPGQCAEEYSMTINVSDSIIPIFDKFTACQGAFPPTLPRVSNNGVIGTWEPQEISTDIIGISDYTFTPDVMEGGCGKTTTIQVEITKRAPLTFGNMNLCVNSIAPQLPEVEGINGKWVPSEITTNFRGNFSYTFKPESGQCVDEGTLIVSVNLRQDAHFNPVGPLCANSSAELPLKSKEDITGTWFPSATIDTRTSGTFTYRFVPDEAFCANEYTTDVEIYKPITVNVTYEPIKSFGESTEVTVTASGGSGTYTSGVGTYTLPSGYHTFVVSDDKGCSGEGAVYVSEPQDLTLTLEVLDRMKCAGGTDRVQVSASGGTEPYSFSFKGGNSSSIRLADGTYLLFASDIPYEFEVFDKNGLYGAAEPLFVTDPEGLKLTGSFTLPTCFGGNDATATVTVTGAYGNILYYWDDPQMQANTTAYDLKAGTYTVTVNDDCGKEKKLTIVIPEPAIITVAALGIRSTCMGSDGQIDFTFTNVPDGMYDISHDDGIFSDVQVTSGKALVSAPVGTYTNLKIKVKSCLSGNGISATVSPAIPQIVNAVAVQPTCTVPAASIIVTDPKPNTGFQYSKDDGQTWQALSFFTNLKTDTTYRIRVQKNGCISDFKEVKINKVSSIPDAPTAGNITHPSCLKATGSVVLNGLPEGNWTLIRTPGDVTTNGAGSSITILGLLPGTYQFTVKNALGCISVASADVTINNAPELPTIAVDSIQSPNACGSNGSIFLTFTNVPDGVYTIKHSAGSFDNVLIASGRATLSVPAGTYNDLQLSIDGCTSAPGLKVTLSDLTAPAAPIAGVITPPTCINPTGSVVLEGLPATGTWTLKRNPGGITSTGTGIITTISGLIPGTYSFTVTDDAGCTSNVSTDVVIQQPSDLPVIALGGIVTPVDCGSDGSILLTFINVPDGTYTITHSTGSFNDVIVAKGKATISAPAGTYNNLILSVGDCTSAIGVNVVVTDPTAPSAPIAEILVQPGCKIPTGSVLLKGLPATGFWTLTRMPEGITLTGTGSSTTVSELLPGTYTFAVTNESGCTSVSSAEVVINELPDLPVIVVKGIIHPLSCGSTGSILLSFTGVPDGNYSIQHRNGSFDNVAVSSDTATIKAVAGIYNDLQISVNGCVSVVGVNAILNDVQAPSAPIVGELVMPTCAVANGTVVLSGLPDGNWIINPGNIRGNTSTFTVTGLKANTIYNFTVTDEAGCTSAPSAIAVNTHIPGPAIPTANVIVQPTCDIPTGTIKVLTPVPAEGIAYMLSVENNAIDSITNTTGLFENLAPGSSYHIKVIDLATGCVSAEIIKQINVMPASPNAPELTVSVKPSCNNPDGTVMVTRPRGADYQYSIDGGPYQGSAIFAGLRWGDHVFKVRNIKTGCVSDETKIMVPAIPPPPVITAKEDPSICFGGTGYIEFSITNVEAGNYTIHHEKGQFEVAIRADGTGKVAVPVGEYKNLTMEVGGCSSYNPDKIVNVEVTQPDDIVISETITPINLATNEKATVSLTVTGGNGNYIYNWGNGETSKDLTNLDAGSYTVRVSDQNGCYKDKTIEVPLPTVPRAFDDSFIARCNIISGNVILNDIDQENDRLFIAETSVLYPKHGTLLLSSDGTFEYRADLSYTGIDSFKYALFDKNRYPGIHGTVILEILPDKDRDGITDTVDKDLDGDGILNDLDGLADADGDGLPNNMDIDSDGDGIPDQLEAQGTANYIKPAFLDVNNNGVDDAYDNFQFTRELIPVDTDNDGFPDYLDLDSDDDLVPDFIEGHDANADGKPDHVAKGKDADGDGLDDGYDTYFMECDPTDNIIRSNAATQDFEGDGIPDWRDDNDDNDEFLTKYEDMDGNGDLSDDDFDYDGSPEYLDYGRECDMFIPNAFSPDGDGIHDFYQIYCINHYPNAKIYIFDQLGNKLFEKANYGNLEVWKTPENAWWDGMPDRGRGRGELVAPGTYYYVLDLGNGEVKKSFVFVSY